MKVGQRFVIKPIEHADILHQRAGVVVKAIADFVDVAAHVFVLLQDARNGPGLAKQSRQQAALAVRVELLHRKSTQGRHHFAQRLTGRPGVLVAHALQHLVGHRGDFALGGSAKEQDGVAVVDIDLGQGALDLRKLGGCTGAAGVGPTCTGNRFVHVMISLVDAFALEPRI